MKYRNIVPAKFIERPNRFIARVDLVAVETPDRIVNIDFQAPNIVVKEWLETKHYYDRIQPEYK